MHFGRAGRLVVALVASVLTSGCAHAVTQHVAPFHTGQPQPALTRAAPETAVYKVKIFDQGKYRGVNGTERFVGRGETLGFRTDADGALQAVANKDVIALRLPPGRVIAWCASYREQTQFGREVDKALGAAGEVAGTAAVLGLLGATAAAEGYLNSLDDCDDSFAPTSHRHGDRHDGGGKRHDGGDHHGDGDHHGTSSDHGGGGGHTVDGDHPVQHHESDGNPTTRP